MVAILFVAMETGEGGPLYSLGNCFSKHRIHNFKNTMQEKEMKRKKCNTYENADRKSNKYNKSSLFMQLLMP